MSLSKAGKLVGGIGAELPYVSANSLLTLVSSKTRQLVITVRFELPSLRLTWLDLSTRLANKVAAVM